MTYTFCAPCHFGLEHTLKFELQKLGATDIQPIDGRVDFSGDLCLLARANVFLSAGQRVYLKLASFEAKTFEDLFQGMLSVPLEEWIGRDDAFPVTGHQLRSQIHSVPAIQSVMKKAAVKRLARAYHQEWFSETGEKHPLVFWLHDNRCELYLDTSGESLHKRGYRLKANLAPIEETLAAGIVDVAHVRRDSVVCDPMCGSGTILIEAALKATRRAPGMNRTFLAESWQSVPQKIWSDAREEARDRIETDTGFHAYGSDMDGEAINIARENAERAGVAHLIDFTVGDVRDFSPPEGAITITNPPYGERLGDLNAARKLTRILGDVLSANAANPCHIISPDIDFELNFGRIADKRRKLYNGNLNCTLYSYYK